MSFEIEYSDLSGKPHMGYVKEFVADSAMTEKNIVDHSYNPIEMWLKVWTETELSTDDKAILDTIVADAIGKQLTGEDRNTIMASIYDQAEPVTQIPRLMGALNTQAVFIVALDNYNFELALGIVDQLLAAGAITQDDHDLVDTIIPASKWVDAS